MSENAPGSDSPPPGTAKRLRRTAGLAAVAGLIVLAYLLGTAAPGFLSGGGCSVSGGVWSDRFGVCECANYGGQWRGNKCVGAKR